jgi:hypothetical protein
MSQMSQTPGLGSGGGVGRDGRTHSRPLTTAASLSSGRNRNDTPTGATTDQTPGPGSGGGDANLVRTFTVPDPPAAYGPHCRSSSSSANLCADARRQHLWNSARAADQTPGPGSGGGSTDGDVPLSVIPLLKSHVSFSPCHPATLPIDGRRANACTRHLQLSTLSADQTPGPGSGGGTPRQNWIYPARPSPPASVYAPDLGSAASGRISSDSLPAARQVRHQPSKSALHYAPSSISELGSGTQSGVTVYAPDLSSAASGRISSASLPAERQVCHQPSKTALHYAPSSISEPGSGTLSGVTAYASDLGSATLGRISSDFLPAERQVCHQPSKTALHYAPPSTSELSSPVEALRSLDAHVLGLETVTAPQAPPGMSAATELTPTPCSILPIAGQGHARPPDIPHA